MHVSITKGENRRLTTVYSKVEKNVHTFLYVSKKLYYKYSGLELLVSITEFYIYISLYIEKTIVT